jgi:hypothetical protein
VQVLAPQHGWCVLSTDTTHTKGNKRTGRGGLVRSTTPLAPACLPACLPGIQLVRNPALLAGQVHSVPPSMHHRQDAQPCSPLQQTGQCAHTTKGKRFATRVRVRPSCPRRWFCAAAVNQHTALSEQGASQAPCRTTTGPDVQHTHNCLQARVQAPWRACTPALCTAGTQANSDRTQKKREWEL